MSSTSPALAERLAAGRHFFDELLADEKLCIVGSPEVLAEVAAEAKGPADPRT